MSRALIALRTGSGLDGFYGYTCALRPTGCNLAVRAGANAAHRVAARVALHICSVTSFFLHSYVHVQPVTLSFDRKKKQRDGLAEAHPNLISQI